MSNSPVYVGLNKHINNKDHTIVYLHTLYDSLTPNCLIKIENYNDMTLCHSASVQH